MGAGLAFCLLGTPSLDKQNAGPDPKAHRYVGSRYFITNLRIIFKAGILFKNIQSISISKIERVAPYKKWYQRIFNTGRIEIYGIGNAYYKLNKLSDVMVFFKRFESAQHAGI